MTVMMKAFRRQGKTPWAAATVKVPVPTLGREQVLLRPRWVGCCGSDLHVLNCAPGSESFAAEFTFGHEVDAVVESVAADVDSVQPGDRVTFVAIQGCGACTECSSGLMQLCEHRRVQGLSFDGGLAEFVVVQQRFVKKIPHDLPDFAGALIEPTTILEHALRVLGDVRGQKILLSGPGIIGDIGAFLLRNAGADVTIAGAVKDQPIRLKIMANQGFKTVIADAKLPSVTDQYRDLNGGPADILFDAAGVWQAVAEGYAKGYRSAVRPGGKLALVSIFEKPVPDFFWTSLVRWQRHVVTFYGSDPSEYDAAIKHLADGVVPIAPLIMEFPLDQAFRAYEAARDSLVLKPIIAIQ